MTAHFTPHLGPCQWSDGDLILTDADEVATIRAGSAMRSMQCISCLNSVGGKPVSIIHVALGHQCARGHSHLAALAVFIHADCLTPPDDVLIERLGAMVEVHRV